MVGRITYLRVAMEHDLYNTIGNIDVCTECRLLKSQSRYYFSRHDGFLDTQDGRYQSPYFIDAHHQVFVDPPLTHRRGHNFSRLNRYLLSKEKNHSSTTSDLLSPNYTTVACKTSFTLPQAQKVLRHIEQGFSRMFNHIRSSAQ